MKEKIVSDPVYTYVLCTQNREYTYTTMDSPWLLQQRLKEPGVFLDVKSKRNTYHLRASTVESYSILEKKPPTQKVVV